MQLFTEALFIVKSSAELERELSCQVSEQLIKATRSQNEITSEAFSHSLWWYKQEAQTRESTDSPHMPWSSSVFPIK